MSIKYLPFGTEARHPFQASRLYVIVYCQHFNLCRCYDNELQSAQFHNNMAKKC